MINKMYKEGTNHYMAAPLPEGLTTGRVGTQSRLLRLPWVTRQTKINNQ